MVVLGNKMVLGWGNVVYSIQSLFLNVIKGETAGGMEGGGPKKDPYGLRMAPF